MPARKARDAPARAEAQLEAAAPVRPLGAVREHDAAASAPVEERERMDVAAHVFAEPHRVAGRGGVQEGVHGTFF